MSFAWSATRGKVFQALLNGKKSGDQLPPDISLRAGRPCYDGGGLKDLARPCLSLTKQLLETAGPCGNLSVYADSDH